VCVWQLVELIDGYRHVASIAQLANGDIDVVKSRVANLVWVAINFVSTAIATTGVVTAAAAAAVQSVWLVVTVSAVMLLH